MIELLANSRDPDQMTHSSTSDLGLHCLPVTHLGVSSLKWANKTVSSFEKMYLNKMPAQQRLGLAGAFKQFN